MSIETTTPALPPDAAPSPQLDAQARRAEQNRLNAQKSTGPRSANGKLRSAKNALKHGRRADLFKNLIPPHAAVLCNQDRQRYYRLGERFFEKYQPHDHAEALLIVKITEAEWRSERIDSVHSAVWNQELIESFDLESSPFPEMRELGAEIKAAKLMANNNGSVDRFVLRFRKEQDRIILASEKRLITMRKHFPSPVKTVERSEFDQSRREYYRSSGFAPDFHDPTANEATKLADQTQ